MSINADNFYMVPKELHNTDMNLSEVYLYSRMMDDYNYFNKRYGVYAPSHEALAAYLQSNRAQTAADTIKELVKKGLVVDTGSKHGGRKVYVVNDYKKVEGLITKLPIAERRKDKSRLTESVKQTNGKREADQRKALTSLTESDDMSDLNHTSITLKSDLIEEALKEIEGNQIPPKNDETESDSSIQCIPSTVSNSVPNLTEAETPEEVITVTPQSSTRIYTPQDKYKISPERQEIFDIRNKEYINEDGTEFEGY